MTVNLAMLASLPTRHSSDLERALRRAARAGAGRSARGTVPPVSTPRQRSGPQPPPAGTQVAITLTAKPGDHAIVRVIAAPHRELADPGRAAQLLDRKTVVQAQSGAHAARY